MFVCSVKANTLKFFGVIAVALTALIMLIIFVPGEEVTSAGTSGVIDSKISYDKVSTPEDAVKFLSQFGWTVEGTPTEEVSIKIPSEFDKVMNSYNQLQMNQGLDLTKYKGHEVTRYTFRVTNYPDYTGTVYANVIICKKHVVGGDICSSDVSGFIHGFESPSSDNAK